MPKITHQDKYTDAISVRGARVNNLHNVDVDVPRGSLTVITGVSGSGKSSLAFDALYAEGQRRYVESLSTYARQFMGKMNKPDVDKITGLPPAIAIEQKVNTRNPRSTVGTSTEIYDYLRLLFGRIGQTISPVSGMEVKRHTVADVIATALQIPEGTRIAVATTFILPEGRDLTTQIDVMLKAGYSRLVTPDGKFVEMSDLLKSSSIPTGAMLLIDRLSMAHQGDELSRLTDSVETAFYEGHGEATLLIWDDMASSPRRMDFSTRFEADGITFAEPNEQMFNFNNPYGACPRCEGFGKVMGIDERLVIPDTSLSIYEDAVVCWRGEKMSQWKHHLISLASTIGFPIHRPYNELTEDQRHTLWHGRGEWPGIDGFFKMVEENLYKIQYRVMLARYRGKTLCPDCHGSRLRPDAKNVKVADATITDLVRMPISTLHKWFGRLKLNKTHTAIAARLLTEITNRLAFLDEVGLGYLTLDRLSSTLSGGESQRINLATSLGSSLMGSMYVLDEPSIGLHSRDTARLVGVLRKLQNIGNTVVVVEHDEDIIRAADNIIDVGPDAGVHGGEIVYQGPLKGITEASRSHTARYLDGSEAIPVPTVRRRWRDYVELTNVRENNLKGFDIRFPLGVMTVVTGVSGSGKSTLVRNILYRALSRAIGEGAGEAPGEFGKLRGDISRIHSVEFVDQNPIGKSTRSNPATYLKAYDEIRRLYADQQAAKQMGFGPGYFSFNAEGGRCEECKGEGRITVEMQFMADITIECEECHGKRFKRDVLEVRYRDKDISEILDMSVDQAIEFFGQIPDGAFERKIVRRLKPLSEVGLGYIKLGQSSSTLSGGENQRVKLASYIAAEKSEPSMLIFDEPTTGLHFHDIATLLHAFDRLISLGHTIVIIEHNMDVIKCADHIIDIGPEGGDAGGYLVATGTPEDIAACHQSYTGHYLSQKLQQATTS